MCSTRIASLLTAAAFAAASALAIAQPSAYFIWKHKTSGKTMCEPQAPDNNWVRVSGPYSDPNCTQLDKQ